MHLICTRRLLVREQNPDILACHTANPDILIFDRTKHSSNLGAAVSKLPCKPDVRLKGHSKEGFGLAWSPVSEGKLVSGANDFMVTYYEVQAAPTGSGASMAPLSVRTGHCNAVNDVAFSCFQADVFASGGDDGKLLLWDARSSDLAGM